MKKVEKITDSYDIIKSNLVQMIICTNIGEDDKESLKLIEEHIQRINPAGTSNNWKLFNEDGKFILEGVDKKDIQGDPKPCVSCDTATGRFHYVLMC